MRIPFRKPTKFSHIPVDPLLTPAKFAELKQKLAVMKTISQPRAAAEVARLAETGDFSENAGYQNAKGRLRGINNAILKLEDQLNHAIIISPQPQTHSVQVGNTVTVAIGGAEKAYQILGSSETNPQKGIISHSSPIGAALLGRKVGDLIAIRLADREVEYRIMKIK